MIALAYIKLLRPHQWLKNLMLFFPPFLGGAILQPGLALRGLAPFTAFCLISSAAYIVNDIRDRERDAHHPAKCHRPLAAGLISPAVAWAMAVAATASAALLALREPRNFQLLLLAYVAVSTAYTFWLKDIAVVDLFCIAAGFLLRLEAGGAVFGIVISDWLFLSVFLLAIFLSTGKRYSERRALGNAAGDHRQVLLDYPKGFLEGAMYMSGSVVLVTYTMYVVGRPTLIYTVPLCWFGLFRYIFRIKSGENGDPVKSLLRDVPLFFVSLLWALMVGWALYGQ